MPKSATFFSESIRYFSYASYTIVYPFTCILKELSSSKKSRKASKRKKRK